MKFFMISVLGAVLTASVLGADSQTADGNLSVKKESTERNEAKKSKRPAKITSRST